MEGFVRPAPDVTKIIEAWQNWQNGGDDVLPGRTMADLKIGGVDRMLADLAEQGTDAEALAASWNTWERGKAGPLETLDAIAAAGFADIVEALTAE